MSRLPALKDNLTYWHQIATLAGIPAALAVSGWVAMQFIEIRDRSRELTSTLTRIEASLPNLWRSVADHETRIRIIESQRGLDKAK